MADSYDKPLPQPDRDSLPFWQGTRAGELRVQRCNACSRYRFPARAVCANCHSFDASWVSLSGRGRILSWITTHRAFMPAYAEEVPYTVVHVALDEQPDVQMFGLLEGAEPRGGMPVRAVFVRVTEDETLVHWSAA